MASNVQSSFLGGEWSKSSQGRYDLPGYATAMAQCVNGVPTENGAWVRRSGTKNLGHTHLGNEAKLVPFDFIARSPYHLEFTEGYLRFIDDDGLVTNLSATVTGISTATPPVVTTSAAHGFTTGDTVIFTGLAGSALLLPGAQFIITVLTTTTFSLANALTAVSITGSAGGTGFTGSATVSRVSVLATELLGGAFRDVSVVQAVEKLGQKAFILSGTPVYELATADEEVNPPVFTITRSQFIDGPYLDPVPTGSLVTPSAKTGIVTMTLSFDAYVATKAYKQGDYVTNASVNYKSLLSNNLNKTPAGNPTYWSVVASTDPIGPSGLQSTDIGRHVRLYSEPLLWSSTTAYVATNLVSYNDVYYVSLTSNTNKIPGNDTTNWALATNAALWSWGRITALLNQISQTLAGAANIGDMTSGGGLAASYDGLLNQTDTAGSYKLVEGTGAAFSAYIGRNYSGASAQAISFATIHPSSNLGLYKNKVLFGSSEIAEALQTVTVNLRAKATLPANAADGTLLGTTTLTANLTSPLTIASSNTVTTWNYVWFEFTIPALGSSERNAIYASEVQFFNPAGATSNGFSLEILGPDLLYTTSIRTWRLGAYSGSTSWPTCGVWQDGRLWLSGAIKNRIDASMSNDPLTFSPTDKNAAVNDNNAISYIFNAKLSTSIFWLEADVQGVVAGTSRGEWIVKAASNSSGISPTNIQARPDTRVGCADVQPVRTENSILYVQSAGRKLIEHFSDSYSGKFAAPTLNAMAKHLTKSGISELAYQQELAPVAWMRTGGGALLGCTYRRDTMTTSAPPTFNAWHQHPLGSDLLVESMAVAPSADGSLSRFVCTATSSFSDKTVVSSVASNVRYLYQMMPLFEEDDGLETSWSLDGARAPSFVFDTGTITRLYGLALYDGATVSVTRDGIDLGTFACASGILELPDGNDPAADYVVGYAFTSTGQLLRPYKQEDTGAGPSSAFAKTRRAHQFGLQFVDTVNIVSVGTDVAKLVPANLRKPSTVAYTSSELFSGIHWDTMTDNYTLDSQFMWRATRPGPITVVAAGSFVQAQDR